MGLPAYVFKALNLLLPIRTAKKKSGKEACIRKDACQEKLLDWVVGSMFLEILAKLIFIEEDHDVIGFNDANDILECISLLFPLSP